MIGPRERSQATRCACSRFPNHITRPYPFRVSPDQYQQPAVLCTARQKMIPARASAALAVRSAPRSASCFALFRLPVSSRAMSIRGALIVPSRPSGNTERLLCTVREGGGAALAPVAPLEGRPALTLGMLAGSTGATTDKRAASLPPRRVIDRARIPAVPIALYAVRVGCLALAIQRTATGVVRHLPGTSRFVAYRVSVGNAVRSVFGGLSVFVVVRLFGQWYQ